MYTIYVHEDAPPRDNVTYSLDLDGDDIDAWVCGPDDPDRAVFDEAGEGLGVVFDTVEAAVVDLVCRDVEVITASAAWTRKEGKNKNGGLNEKGRKSYSGNLKRPTPRGPRHKSFCARMKGMKKKLTGSKARNDKNSRINKSLRKWDC